MRRSVDLPPPPPYSEVIKRNSKGYARNTNFDKGDALTDKENLETIIRYLRGLEAEGVIDIQKDTHEESKEQERTEVKNRCEKHGKNENQHEKSILGKEKANENGEAQLDYVGEEGMKGKMTQIKQIVGRVRATVEHQNNSYEMVSQQIGKIYEWIEDIEQGIEVGTQNVKEVKPGESSQKVFEQEKIQKGDIDIPNINKEEPKAIDEQKMKSPETSMEDESHEEGADDGWYQRVGGMIESLIADAERAIKEQPENIVEISEENEASDNEQEVAKTEDKNTSNYTITKGYKSRTISQSLVRELDKFAYIDDECLEEAKEYSKSSEKSVLLRRRCSLSIDAARRSRENESMNRTRSRALSMRRRVFSSSMEISTALTPPMTSALWNNTRVRGSESKAGLLALPPQFFRPVDRKFLKGVLPASEKRGKTGTSDTVRERDRDRDREWAVVAGGARSRRRRISAFLGNSEGDVVEGGRELKCIGEDERRKEREMCEESTPTASVYVLMILYGLVFLVGALLFSSHICSFASEKVSQKIKVVEDEEYDDDGESSDYSDF